MGVAQIALTNSSQSKATKMIEFRRGQEDSATILAASNMAAIPDPLSPTAGIETLNVIANMV